jgi:hypothetical protein
MTVHVLLKVLQVKIVKKIVLVSGMVVQRKIVLVYVVVVL